MALVWERQQLIEGGQNIYDYPVGGVEVSLGNKFPDLIKIEGFRVKIVARHLSRLEPGLQQRRSWEPKCSHPCQPSASGYCHVEP
jgi:hypothetical protein